jgi:hypothetical protein
MADNQRRQDHQHNLSDLAPNDDLAFTESVGQISGRSGQQQIGQYQTGRPHRKNRAPLFWRDQLLADPDRQPP